MKQKITLNINETRFTFEYNWMIGIWCRCEEVIVLLLLFVSLLFETPSHFAAQDGLELTESYLS